MYLPFGEEYGFHNICIDGMQITLIVFETEIALGEFEQRRKPFGALSALMPFPDMVITPLQAIGNPKFELRFNIELLDTTFWILNWSCGVSILTDVLPKSMQPI